jgi:hypothetical protein
MRVAERAGIAEHVHPHDLRHAFADQIARGADPRTAQHLLGHAHLGTTDTYLGKPRLDDLVLAVSNLSYETRTNVLGVSESLQKALEATTGIEPVFASAVEWPVAITLHPRWSGRCHYPTIGSVRSSES